MCVCVCVCVCVCREDGEISGLERQMLRENRNHGKGELLGVQNVICHMDCSCDLNQHVGHNGKPCVAQFHHLPV